MLQVSYVSKSNTIFKQLRLEAWKGQDYNRVGTYDLAIPVRGTNELTYEATDVGSWSVVSSNEPVKNGCEVIYDPPRENKEKGDDTGTLVWYAKQKKILSHRSSGS